MNVLMVGGGTLGSVTPLLAVAEELGRQCRLSFLGTRRGPERAVVEAAGIPFRSIPSGKLRRYWDVRNVIDVFVIAWAFFYALHLLWRWRSTTPPKIDAMRSAGASSERGVSSFRSIPRFLARSWADGHRPMTLARPEVATYGERAAQRSASPEGRGAREAGFARSQGSPTARDFRGVVVGAGSFVQVPVVWAAALLRIPIVLLQSDVRPGLANRLGAPFARRILTAWPETADQFPRARTAVVGVPVRRAVHEASRDAAAAKRALGFDGTRPLLLIIGGSQGAARLNALVSGALLQHTGVLHVTGPGKGSAMPNPQYRAVPFLTDDLPTALVASDLIVARAGMGTISELASLGKPAIIIPIATSHQEENAAALASRGAAEVWDERTLTPDTFVGRVRALLDDAGRRAAIARASASVFPMDAAARIAAIIVMER